MPIRAKLLTEMYPRVIDGLPVIGTPVEIVDNHRQYIEGDTDHTALITHYTLLCGATGFVCGIPGLLLLPVTLPANVAGVAALHLHMAASFAYLAGNDLDEVATRDAIVDCLVAASLAPTDPGTDEAQEVSNRTGLKLLERAGSVLTGSAVSLVKRTSRDMVLGRLGLRRLPLLGAVFSASGDGYLTIRVGRHARACFLPKRAQAEITG